MTGTEVTRTTARWELRLSPFIKRVLAVLAVALGVLSIASRVSFSLSPRGVTNDFTQDYISARAWNDRLDPYGDTGLLVDHYFGPGSPYHAIVQYGQGGTPHPPALILLVRPIAFMPYKAARITWLLLMAVATAFGLGWFARSIGASRAVATVVGIGGLAIPVVQTDLVYGQSTGLLLLLLVVAWLSLSRGRDAAAGIALGLAAALKIFPILMAIPLVRARRLRAVIWLFGCAVVVGGISAILIGVHRTIEFVRTVSPQNVRFWRAAPMNLSLLSLPYRWLTKSVWRPGASNFPTIASGLAMIAFIALIAAAYLSRSGLTGDLYWETVPIMLLAVPTVWETYLVLAVPLTLLFVQGITRAGIQRRWVVSVAFALISIGVLPGMPPALHTPNAAQALGYSLPMYGLLGIALASVFWRSQSPGSGLP